MRRSRPTSRCCGASSHLPNGEGRGLITTEHEAYALPTAGYQLDLARFDELTGLAEDAEPSARRRYLEDALALATGSVLADEPYSDWAMDERWRYERPSHRHVRRCRGRGDGRP